MAFYGWIPKNISTNPTSQLALRITISPIRPVTCLHVDINLRREMDPFATLPSKKDEQFVPKISQLHFNFVLNSKWGHEVYQVIWFVITKGKRKKYLYIKLLCVKAGLVIDAFFTPQIYLLPKKGTGQAHWASTLLGSCGPLLLTSILPFYITAARLLPHVSSSIESRRACWKKP